MRTKFDHYLRTLAMRYEVRCLSLPSILPNGVKVVKEKNLNVMWKFVLHCERDSIMQQVVACMKRDRQSYTLATYYKKTWWAALINPEGRSFTYSMVSSGLGLAGVSGVVWGLMLSGANLGLFDSAKLLFASFSH
jgi:hypothetical protein